MAKVRCDYCGGYIQDTDERCPNCGAVNENYKRVVSDTPQTIEELKDWYRARNLPPEETTRFFIGKNIKEARAFGIYEENGQYIVYKNKGDGSRAIRYQGTDEAYAVNELYLKLKEEILHQKSLNIAKRNKRQSGYSRPFNEKRYNKKARILGILIGPIICIIAFFGISSFVFSQINFDYDLDHGYYIDTNDNIYYRGGKDYQTKLYEWWKFDNTTNEWSQIESLSEENFPPNVIDKQYRFATDLADVLNIDYETIDIYRSRAYIDAGHRYISSENYYLSNNKLYYYLDDYNGKDYGTRDNTGWYVYNNNNWEYLCDNDDKETLGDDLWYNYNDRKVYDWDFDFDNTDAYAFAKSTGFDWNTSKFESTTWYQEKEKADEKHKQKIEENNKNNNNNRWDNDNDYDWDAGDDWDAGGMDWDSDW